MILSLVGGYAILSFGALLYVTGDHGKGEEERNPTDTSKFGVMIWLFGLMAGPFMLAGYLIEIRDEKKKKKETGKSTRAWLVLARRLFLVPCRRTWNGRRKGTILTIITPLKRRVFIWKPTIEKKIIYCYNQHCKTAKGGKVLSTSDLIALSILAGYLFLGIFALIYIAKDLGMEKSRRNPMPREEVLSFPALIAWIVWPLALSGHIANRRDNKGGGW